VRASVALAVASLLLLSLALELASRVWLPPPRHHLREPLVFDAELGFRGDPGARLEGFDARGPFVVRFDENGLRLRAHPDPEPPAQRSIALLGDSFAVAKAVRDGDTLSGRLESLLRERGAATRVHDLAVVDYGTAQQLLWLRGRAKDLRYDTLVLALYPGNDFANNTLALAGRTNVSPGDYVRPYLVPDGDGGFALGFAHPVRAWLRRHSHLFACLEQRALSRLAPWPAPEPPPARLHAGRPPREELELHRDPAPGSAWDDAWHTSEALLLALRAEARAHAARFVVLVIPGAHQVEEDAMHVRLDLLVRRHAHRGLRELLDWNLPERRLAAFFEKNEIEAVLLLDPFRAAAAHGERLYLPDGHFSASGHALAARLLADVLAGDAFAHAAAPRSPGPAALLPDPARAPAQLDFRSAAFEPYLVRGGWLAHRTTGSSAGWLPAARACLVLPARRGDLVLRGRVPEHAALPIAASLRIGNKEQRARLAHAGEFDVRLPAPLAADEPRWVAVDLSFAGRAQDGRPAELTVESVGYELELDR
jgi:hypothetical protein